MSAKGMMAWDKQWSTCSPGLGKKNLLGNWGARVLRLLRNPCNDGLRGQQRRLLCCAAPNGFEPQPPQRAPPPLGSRSSVLPAAGTVAALARLVTLWAASLVRSALLAAACLAPAYICRQQGGGHSMASGQAARVCLHYRAACLRPDKQGRACCAMFVWLSMARAEGNTLPTLLHRFPQQLHTAGWAGCAGQEGGVSQVPLRLDRL